MSSNGAHSDSGMVKVMAGVMGALTIITIVIMIAARSLSGDGVDDSDTVLRQALLERIAPAGNVRTELPAETAAAASVMVADLTGEQLVNEGSCAACHAAGVGGAPKTGDDAAWGVRRELGLEALVASVLNGKGTMPARGASTYSDDEITRAVQFLAGLGDSSSAVEPSEGDATAEPSEGEATAEPSEGDATAGADDQEQPQDDAAAVVVSAAGASAGLTDKVKNTVDALCAGCHVSGIANAPKIGDTAAWAPRIELGFEAMAKTVISGKGAMPARGGSTLTDDEIVAAVEYLANKK